MMSNRLQLNTAKSEVTWSATSHRQCQLPTSAIRIGNDQMVPVKLARNLGIYLDANVSMSTHKSRTVSSCFSVLRQLRTVKRSFPTDVFIHRVVNLILSKLDFGIAALYELSDTHVQKLKTVMNAGARLKDGSKRCEHFTHLLRQLHWLRARERVIYKVALLTYHSIRDSAPVYLTDSLHRRVDEPGRRHLASSASSALVVPRTRLKTIRDGSFSAAAPVVWNSLPTHVTSAASVDIFKKRPKIHLFSLSFL
jgi:hypothetical protein